MGRERPKAARQRERENRRIPGLRELVGCGVGEENVGVYEAQKNVEIRRKKKRKQAG